MIDLLTEKPFPVRRCDGSLDWISPHQLSEPDIVAFAANRADFNAALAQWAIALLQTTSPAQSEADWERLFDNPPDAEELAVWLAPFAEAFKLDGDGPRFMQDPHLDSGAECGIDALLIDAAGGSAVDRNTDLFVKRDTIGAMCPHCAATALFTLQTNAPAGGAGHRTSLRGGGPLTTLVLCTPARSLWHDLWLNVFPQDKYMGRGGDAAKTAPHFTFPWLAATEAIQPAGGETAPVMVHPKHVYWAMPRRIRLDFDNLREGRCDVCHRDSAQLVTRYLTRPQGLNYKGPWRHPLSPYYETKEGWLPVHPQPGGFSYRHWLSWALGSSSNKKTVQAAANVAYVLEDRRHTGAPRLWVSGFDMDNAKARCWYETTFPLYRLADCKPAQRKHVQKMVAALIEAAELAAYYLRQAVKKAWFGDGDARGDLSFTDKMFWDATDGFFHRHLRQLVEAAASEAGVGQIGEAVFLGHAEAWRGELAKTVVKLFDKDIVGAAGVGEQDPRRIALAYGDLKKNMDDKAMRALLGLPQDESGKAKSKVNPKATNAVQPV